MASLTQLLNVLKDSVSDMRRISILLDDVIQQMPSSVFELDKQGRISYANEVACRFLNQRPNDLTGKRFADLVVDSVMTERRIEKAFSVPNETLKWLAEFSQRESMMLMAQAISTPIDTLYVWEIQNDISTNKADTESKKPSSTDLALPINRRVCGRDLDRFRKKLDIPVKTLCELLGVTTTSWYSWRKKAQTPVSSRPAELHLRLLDHMQELAAQSVPHPGELLHLISANYGITLSWQQLALLMGSNLGAAYHWSSGGQPQETVLGLTQTLFNYMQRQPADKHFWQRYQAIVEQQARIEGVELSKIRSWP